MLNPAQKQAVNATGGCLLITAPPGSGKTTVLKERAVFLLKSNPRAKLAAVTFTADAASELEERILKSAPELKDRLIAGTFHALCKKQLEQAGDRFRLVSESQRFELIRRAHAEVSKGKTLVNLEMALMKVDWIKSQVNAMINPSDAAMVQCYDIYSRYQQLLGQMGAVDFSDLLINAVKGMNNGQIAPLDVAYLLVDEFQDTDPVQYAWAKEHFRRGVECTVVGDDDQAIYGWRNALGYSGMQRFCDDTNASHISLNTSYRCPREILNPAATLIGHISARVEKTIQTGNLRPGKIIIKPFENDVEEIAGILDAITLSGSKKDWGILARSNKQLDELVNTIGPARMKDFRRKGGTNFWEFRGPALFLGVCNSLTHGNMLGVDELLRRCAVSEDRIAKLHARHLSISSGALDSFIAEHKGNTSKDTIGRLGYLMNDWKRLLNEGSYMGALNGVADFIKKNAKLQDKDKFGEMRERDVKGLNDCVKYLSKLRGPLSQRIIHATKEAEDNNEDVSKIMTLHSAKGLEFRYVWIMGCQQGIVPSKQSTDIDEERRLFYVGMTRAIERLYCSYITPKGDNPVPKSQFIDEAAIKS